jgi:alpha-galactosidase
VIAIDQDSLGKQGTRAYSEGEVEVWSRHLAGGALAVCIINTADQDRLSSHPFHLNLARLGLHGAQQGKDLWTGKDIELTNEMPLEVASHDVLLVRIAAPK